MIGDVGEAGRKARRSSRSELTTMSGLALGLAISAGLWAGVAGMVHLLGLF